ncbi:MAG: hypothetical protein ABR517_06565 [Thermoanaerobaculia bacterium]
MSKPEDKGKTEPQSYGSNEDWLEGTTDQTVENTPARTSRHDEEHYENRHDRGPTETPDPGADEANSARSTRGAEVVGTGGRKIAESNQRRRNDGFFRQRDYE